MWLAAVGSSPYLEANPNSHSMMTPLKNFGRALLLVSVFLSLSSCVLEKIAQPVEPTRFIKSAGTDIKQSSSRLPFQHAWRDPKVDVAKYKNIVIRPVSTAYIKADEWTDSKSQYLPTKRRYLRRCARLAKYWDKSLNKTFSSPVCLFYKVNDTSLPNTLILQTALTEARFAQNPLASCAFEAKIIDASNGKVIATVSDRRRPSVKAMTAGTKSISTLNETICDEWSEEIFQASNSELFPVVRRGFFGIY